MVKIKSELKFHGCVILRRPKRPIGWETSRGEVPENPRMPSLSLLREPGVQERSFASLACLEAGDTRGVNEGCANDNEVQPSTSENKVQKILHEVRIALPPPPHPKKKSKNKRNSFRVPVTTFLEGRGGGNVKRGIDPMMGRQVRTHFSTIYFIHLLPSILTKLDQGETAHWSVEDPKMPRPSLLTQGVYVQVTVFNITFKNDRQQAEWFRET